MIPEISPSQASHQSMLNLIRRSSDRVALICGASGGGKKTIMDRLQLHLGFKEPPFVTTRQLRQGEAEDGSYQLNSTQFREGITAGVIFAPVTYLQNRYGYPLHVVHELLKEGERLVIEIPPRSLISTVKDFLPRCHVIALIPDSKFTRQALETRGTETVLEQEKRIRQGFIDALHVNRAIGELPRICQIVPKFGQIDHPLEIASNFIPKWLRN